MIARYTKFFGLVLVLSVCFFQKVYAFHPSGSEIYYKHNGGTSYTFYLNHYYRCNGIPPSNESITITDGKNTISYNCTAGTITNYDVDVATGMCTRCSNPTCSFPFGMSMRLFYVTVDVGVFKGCNLTISWAECCLYSAISTGSAGQTMYTEVKLNRCVVEHSSPVFQEFPVLWTDSINPVQRLQTVTPANRNDSIVYRLVPPLKSAGSAMPYSSRYGYDHFLTYKGTSITDAIPNGFHYNQASGALDFTPKQADVSIAAFEADEYAKDNTGKYYLIGNTLRMNEIICYSFSTGNHNPVIKGINGTSADTIHICAGIQTKFQIKTLDPDSKDSVTLNAINETSGNITYSNAKLQSATFTWTPTNNYVSPKPYHLIFSAKDNVSPIGGYVQKQFYIYVDDSVPVLKIAHADSSCGRFRFSTNADTALHLKFAWYVDSSLKATSPTLVYTFPFNAKHIVNLKITNKVGCVKDFYDTIAVTILPNVKATGGAKICKGSSIKLIASGGVKYQWSPSNSLLADTGATVSASPSKNTLYYVSGTDKKGCKAIDTVKVVVDTIAVKFNRDTTVCRGSNVYIKAFTYKATSYQWLNKAADQLSDSAGLFFKAISDSSYTLKIVDSFGCSNIIPGMIRINKIAAHAGADVTICYGDSVQLHGSGGQVYKWFSGSGLPKGASIANPYVKPLQTFKYVLRVSDSMGCIANDTVKVSVTNIAPITFKPATICQGDSTLLTAYGGDLYLWTPTAGLSNATVAAPYAHPSKTTTYTVTICDPSCGCQRKDSVTITVYPFQKMVLGPDSAICLGSQLTIGNNPLKGYNYSYNSVPAGFQGSLLPVTVSPKKNVLFYVSSKNMANGCEATDSVKISVIPTIHALITGKDSVCTGDSNTYTAKTYDPNQSYVWTVNGGNIISRDKNNVHVSWKSSGTGKIKLVQSVHGQCADSSIMDISIAPRPFSHIKAPSDICVGNQADFSDSGTSAAHYAWNFGDGGTSASAAATHTYAKQGTYKIKLQVGNHGCLVADSTVISVHELKKLIPGILHTGYRQYSFLNTDSAGISALWDLGDGANSKNNSTSHIYADTGKFIIQFHYGDIWGCTSAYDTVLHITEDTAKHLPQVYKDSLSVSPNPFSNQLHIHYSLATTESVQFFIYDAIGQELTRVDKHDMPAGNYTYTVSLVQSRAKPGIYLLKYVSGNKTRVLKLIRI